MTPKNACFIVGTGRCGSTTLLDLLARHPDVLPAYELFASLQPRAFPRGTVTGDEFWSLLATPNPLWTAALHHHAEPAEFAYPVDAGSRFDRESGVPAVAAIVLPRITDDPDELFTQLETLVPGFPAGSVGDHYRRLLQWMTDRYDRRLWVEKSGGSLQYARDLATVAPSAKFIHLYRNCRETAESMSRHPFFLGAAVYRRGGSDAVERFFREQSGRSRSNESRSSSEHGALAVPSLQDLAILWSATMLVGTRVLRNLQPDRVLHLAYETLVTEPQTALIDVLTFLELGCPSLEWLASCTALLSQPSSGSTRSVLARSALDRACRPGERALHETLTRWGQPSGRH